MRRKTEGRFPDMGLGVLVTCRAATISQLVAANQVQPITL